MWLQINCLALWCGKAAIPTEICKRYSNSITGLDRPWGFQEFEAPRFQGNHNMNVVKVLVSLTGRLYLQDIILAPISVRVSVNPTAILRPQGLFNKNFQWHNRESNPRAPHISLTNTLRHPLHFVPGRKPFELKRLVSVCSKQLSVDLYKLYVCLLFPVLQD